MNHKAKNIFVAVVALFMAHQMWGAAESMGNNIKVQMGFGMPLTIGMQMVFWMAIVVLYAMAFQNIFEFYILWKYSKDVEIQETARKVIKFAIYVKIFVSLAMRLIFSFLFIMLALIAFFAPGVANRDGGVYGAGIFMLAVAGFMAYSNIRVAIARVREFRGTKEETE